jgi:hypothetical protein
MKVRPTRYSVNFQGAHSELHVLIRTKASRFSSGHRLCASLCSCYRFRALWRFHWDNTRYPLDFNIVKVSRTCHAEDNHQIVYRRILSALPVSRVPVGAMHGSTSFALKNFKSYERRPRFAMRDRPVARLDGLALYT